MFKYSLRLIVTTFLFSSFLYADGSDIQITVSNASPVQENAGSTSFTISLSEEADWCNVVPVNYTTQNNSATAGNDYTSKSGTITFYGACDAPTRSASSVNQTVSVAILDDTTYEGTENFYLNISNATTGYQVSDANGYANIYDNDIQPLELDNFADKGVTETDSSQIVSMVASFNQNIPTALTLTYHTEDDTAFAGTDYVSASGSVNVPANSNSVVIPITVKGDITPESLKRFKVVIDSISSGTITDNEASVFINDDDGIQVDISSSDVLEGNSGDSNTMEFKIFLTKDYPSTTPLVINYTTQDGSNPSATAGSDYITTSSYVTFNLGDREKIINVPIIGDNVIEPDENLKMVISGSPYIIDSDSESEILNDDGTYPELSFDLSSYSLVEGDSGQKDLNFTLQLDQVAIAGSSFKYTTEDDTALLSNNDYIRLNNKTHTFSGGERSVTIPVKVKGDTNVEANEAFNLKIFDASSNLKLNSSVISSKGIILNDDTAPSAVKNIGEFRFDDCGADEWKNDHSYLGNNAFNASPTVVTNDGKSYMCSSLNGYTGTVNIPHHSAYELDNGTFSMLLYDHHNIWSSNSWMFQKGSFKVEVVRVAGDLHKGSIKVHLDGNVIDTQEVFFTNGGGGDLDTQWVHVAVSFGLQGIKLYINGIEKGSHSYTGGIKSISDNLSMATLSGYYDEFYIFEGQMSPIQVDSLYQNTINDRNLDGTTRDCGCYTPSDPFTCDNSMYISSSTNRETSATGKMWLHRINTTQNPFEFEVMEDTGASELYNATAYNPDDNYIYGLYHRELVRLSRGAEVTNLGEITALPSRFNSKQLYAGAIHGGFYYVSGRNSLSDQLFQVRLSDLSVTTITLSEGVAIQDFSFYKNVNDTIPEGQFLYGVEKDGKLTKIDIINGTVTRIGSDHSNYEFDSSFSDMNGRFFANDSNGNGFFEFNLATGTKNLVSNSQSATFNDGANCINASLVFNDYGDAPASYGTPKHNIANNIFMGNEVDHDVYTFATTNADGDDLDGVDDEDGVTLADGSDLNGTFLALNTLHDLKVKVSKAGYLNVWIDYNIDGDFDDAGEKIVTALSLTTGTHTISVNVPNGLTSNANTYLRFRYSSTANLNATEAANDGEVEDYMVQFGSDALTGRFNIERTNSGNFPIMSDERNAWYTQIVGRTFDYSLVFYEDDFSAEKNVSNVTVRIDLMDMDTNTSLDTYVYHFPETFVGSRKDFTLSDNDLATKNAQFKVTYGVDMADNVVQANCAQNASLCSLYRTDDAYDEFAIRPKSFYIAIADNAHIRKENTNSLVNPLRVAAGYDYNLTVIASTNEDNKTASLGYDASISRLLEFNTAGTCANSDDNISIANFANGSHSDLNFTHDNVGNYILKLQDTTWTQKDLNKTVPDCLLGQSSISNHFNELSGCNIDALSDVNLSFYPHHFDVDFSMNNLPSSGHDDFIYMSDVTRTDHNVSIQFLGSITAQNEQNGTTTNFTEGCFAENIQLTTNAITTWEDGNRVPIQTFNHPSRSPANVDIARMIRFNNEDLNNTTFDTVSDVSNPAINILKDEFLDDKNGTLELDLRYNIQKNLSLAINPVQIEFLSLDVESIPSNSSAEGQIAPNFFPRGSQDLNNTIRNFYFSRVSPDKRNYPKVYFNRNPTVNTPLNVDIFCNTSIEYCRETGINNNTDITGLSRVDDGWYISTNHNTTTDGQVQALIPNSSTANVAPDNNITFVTGRNDTVATTFNSCLNRNHKVTVNITPDTSLLYDDNPTNAGRPQYSVTCSDQNASELSGIGETGNIINNNSNTDKTSKIDW